MPASDSERTVESKVHFQGKILTLRVDQVELPNGRIATREIIEHSKSICVVPVDSQGNVLMVRQFRKPVEAQLLEVVAGSMEGEEDPDEAARRELQEEIGYTTDALQHLSSFWLAPGWCDEYMYAYLATDLRVSPLPPDDDENISVETVPLANIPAMIQSGELQDVKSIAALLLAIQALG